MIKYMHFVSTDNAVHMATLPSPGYISEYRVTVCGISTRNMTVVSDLEWTIFDNHEKCKDCGDALWGVSDE